MGLYGILRINNYVCVIYEMLPVYANSQASLEMVAYDLVLVVFNEYFRILPVGMNHTQQIH
jgi:hypothetical protein